jgi:diguanylate cyclase (GGDEF)-like protein
MSALAAPSSLAAPTVPALPEWLSTELLRHALMNHRAGLLINGLAALGVALMVSTSLPRAAWIWLAVMLALNLLRLAADTRLCQRIESGVPVPLMQADIASSVFTGGFLLAALLWAALALLGLPHMQADGQFTVVVTLSALAGGATGVLAPMRRIGRAYILILLLSGSLGLLRVDPPNWVLAALGCIFAGVMWVGHRNNHALLLRSLELQHDNDRLVERLSESNDAIRSSNQALEQRVAERTVALQQLSRSDGLTGLLNRRGFVEALRERDRPDASLAVLFLDLDRFKQVNDGLGHEAGDAVLAEVARRFTVAAPAESLLARWGGDEFVLALPSEGALCDRVRSLASRLQQALDAPIDLGDERVQLGVSIGYICRSQQEPCTALIAAADLAAADAKRRGRGLALPFEPRLAEQQQRRLQIVSGLRTAIADEALWVAYQPIVRADGHACIGFEALARWKSPRLGNVPPDEFIPIAEDSERILQVGDWVLRRALFEARRSSADVPPRISVNVSLRQLVWDGYIDSVQRALDETGWPADRLVLEVTESVLEDRTSEFTLKVLKRLAQLGLHIHVDDFGAGYSSLSSLHRFPLHAIKIDRVFTQRLDFEACSVIEAAVLIARGHGLKVIAEGVETAEQAGILAGIGVDALQGYLFGRPQAGLPGAAGVVPG